MKPARKPTPVDRGERASRSDQIYQYDANFGDPGATYTAVDWRKTPNHWPEIPAQFVVPVEGEIPSHGLAAADAFAWRTEPGNPCFILGYWSDGSLHVRWNTIGEHYTTDGRLPAWVVEPAVLLRDPHVLPSNVGKRRPSKAPRMQRWLRHLLGDPEARAQRG